MNNLKQVSISRQVFDRESFNNTVGTEFTQLANVLDPSFYDVNLATIEDFWILYNKYFYEIPKFSNPDSSDPNSRFKSRKFRSKTRNCTGNSRFCK